MNATFQAFVDAMVNDDGTGDTGDLMTKTWWTDLMALIDSQMTTTGGIVTENITYYVATTGSDSTGDGSVGNPWATPAYALSILGNYRVQEGKTLTIQCDDGVYSFSAPITNLPKGFLLTGKNTYTKTMSSVQSSSGSAGAWSVVVNLDSVSNVTTSDYAIFSAPSGGTNPTYIAGIWAITAVDAVNNRITVSTTHRGASAPSGAVAATVTINKTILSFIGCSGVSLTRMASGTIKKLIIKGDGTANMDGITMSQSSLAAENCGVTQFGRWGVLVSLSSSLSFWTGVNAISANGNDGIYCNRNSTLDFYGGIVSGNTGKGAWILYSSHLRLQNGIVSGNGGYGIHAIYQGNTSAVSATFTANTSYDVFAEKYGYIDAAVATIGGSTSPAANTQGNEYGYIDT